MLFKDENNVSGEQCLVIIPSAAPHVCTKAANEPSEKFSQLRRKPLLGPSMGSKCLQVLSCLRNYAKRALTH